MIRGSPLCAADHTTTRSTSLHPGDTPANIVVIVNFLLMVAIVIYITCPMPQTSFSDALHRLMHVYRGQLRSGLREHDIDLPVSHIRALKACARIPQCTARCIARRLDRDKSQITRVVNGLLQAGLIEKHPNPKDQRSQILVPSHAGQSLLLTLDSVERESVARLTRNLSTADLDAFSRISTLMIQNTAEPAPSTKER